MVPLSLASDLVVPLNKWGESDHMGMEEAKEGSKELGIKAEGADRRLGKKRRGKANKTKKKEKNERGISHLVTSLPCSLIKGCAAQSPHCLSLTQEKKAQPVGKQTLVNTGGGQMGVITEESDEGNQKDDRTGRNTHTHTHTHISEKKQQTMDAAACDSTTSNRILYREKKRHTPGQRGRHDIG